MFLMVFVPDVLVELPKQDLRILLGTCSTIVPRGDVLLNYFKSCTAQEKSKSSTGWISSGTVFLVFCCHYFSKPSTTTTTTTNHYLPIMVKMMSNLTTSHETPVKSTPGKSVIKINTPVLETSEFRHVLEGNHRINQVRRLCQQQQRRC